MMFIVMLTIHPSHGISSLYSSHGMTFASPHSAPPSLQGRLLLLLLLQAFTPRAIVQGLMHEHVTVKAKQLAAAGASQHQAGSLEAISIF
jgi:hypothetical protein